MEPTPGDTVRIDIPDETDPDHRLHGRHGEAVTVVGDDADRMTGQTRDGGIYRVRLEDTGDGEELVDVRARDPRPPFED